MCFLWLPAPLKPQNKAVWVGSPSSFLPLMQEQLVLNVSQPNSWGNPTATSHRLPSSTSCKGAGCPPASGLNLVVPSSYSPVIGTWGYALVGHLPCARHSMRMGEQGSCIIPDLSELIAQLVIVPPQSSWLLVRSLLQVGAHEAGAL